MTALLGAPPGLIGWVLQDHDERWPYGEKIAMSFVESTVNVAMSKRFCEKQ
jgi:hypothetical protein